MSDLKLIITPEFPNLDETFFCEEDPEWRSMEALAAAIKARRVSDFWIYHSPSKDSCLTAERLEVEPEECIMVDDLPENIAGADAAGMHGIVYGDLNKLKKELNKLLG